MPKRMRMWLRARSLAQPVFKPRPLSTCWNRQRNRVWFKLAGLKSRQLILLDTGPTPTFFPMPGQVFLFRLARGGDQHSTDLQSGQVHQAGIPASANDAVRVEQGMADLAVLGMGKDADIPDPSLGSMG